ncbi:transcription-repair coupling factor [Candidatus Izemoplasma sp. B36]|uniref:transcription-repair coupling factor n=1 Tax=Candidatus Izemoplasma sp. B36 TaxID=3242468 RepID=UPI0035573998
MKRVISFLKENELMNEIINSIRKNKEVYINNTNEENSLLLLLEYFERSKESIFLITPNLYKAQLIFDKLCQVIDSDNICFFPQDEFITNELLVSSMEFRVERINTIKNIISNKKKIVVTNLFGVLKPELPVEKWIESVINLELNKDYSIDQISEKLISYGYKKEYIVEKVGDFAVRGGIIDIYPLGEKNPYRLDFFGETLDLIKSFDIDTQRSIEKKKSIKLLPMVEFFYSEEEFKKIEIIVKNKIKKEDFLDETKEVLYKDLENLENHNELDRLIRYLPFLTDSHKTILDYTDKKTVFFLDFLRLKEQNKILIEEIKEWYLNSGDYPKMEFSMLYDFNEVLNNKSVLIDYLDYSYKSDYKNQYSIFGKEVLTYSNDLNLLYSDLAKNNNTKTTILSFKNKKSLNKLTQILNDKDISYNILNKRDKIIKNKLNLIISEKTFDFNSDSFNLHLITEEAITKKIITRKRGDYVSVYKKSKRLSSVNDLKKGDYVVHYDYGIGKFLEIKTMKFGQQINDYIHLEYKGGDKLYISVDAIDQIHKYSGNEGYSPRLSKLGGSDWTRAKNRVREQVKQIANQLIELYAKRENAVGYKFSEYKDLEEEFRESFPYKETEDQTKTINDVLNDMGKKMPMDRLICGDVGFGKTEIAMRAAFRAVLNGKQVAYLAPTTVLSKQHYNTFKERMDSFGINVAILNRFITKKNQKNILKKLKEGTVDILIGTHRILSNDVIYMDLGLLVIDEEQRFGVLHKEKIKEIKVNVDVLSLSATPIPRTLNMAIMGVKNMSLLETAPENRYPIQTYVLERNNIILKDAIERELGRRGQIFYLYNKVEDIDFIADRIQKLVPEARIDIAHGKMRKIDLEKVVDNFINQEVDILVSTTIIETGIDIPNANTLIVHDADKLGLSQLYQIRGRVGRSDRIAYAYLMYKKNKILTEEAEKRLKVIKEFTELGSGFKIAIRDLSIRGAGDVLGREQSGFIDSVGVDMYMKILEEEISNASESPKIKKQKKGVKAKVSRFIDNKYIEDDFVKIEMHKKINKATTIEQAYEILNELKDRFGKYDQQLEIYIYEKLFEFLTKEIGTEKIIENKTNITLVLTEESSKQIAGDNLFKSGIDISNHIRFAFRRNRIHIILDTLKLDRHWLYTMVDFLQKVVSLNI